MNVEYHISIYLDTRRKKANGKYPVKLRVFTPSPRKQKLYPTKFELTEKEFKEVWLNQKIKTENKSINRKINATIVKAEQVAEKLNPFSFERFEKQLYRKAGDGVRLEYQFTEIIKRLESNDQLGTASSYDLSQKSIKNFVESKLNKTYEKLTLFDINKEFLQNYENYMVNSLERSYSTVGIYLRPLRAIFNTAIEENEIDKEYYPFGKRKYQIPTAKKTKRALNNVQLGKFFNSPCQNGQQQKAKDFWFFSYACSGMNIKDICLLKHKDIKNDSFEFYRAKTKLTKDEKTVITVHLNEFSKSIIEKYGCDNKNPDNYIFDVLSKGMTPQQQRVKIQNFTRFINQHIKNICTANDLPNEISVMWARHSFATNVVRSGASIEFVQESLGHANKSTTQNYFAGFEDKAKKEITANLMNF